VRARSPEALLARLAGDVVGTPACAGVFPSRGEVGISLLPLVFGQYRTQKHSRPGFALIQRR
jgi:hypothetical protein